MTTTAPATARRTPIALYANIGIPVPAPLAARLPESRPGVPPHITLVHSQVDPWQLRRLHSAFKDGAFSISLSGLDPFQVRVGGVGDFRGDTPPTPVVYLRAEAGQLAILAAAFDAEYGLPPRRFPFRPHITLAWRDRALPLAEGDGELDRLKEGFADFDAEFTAEALTFTVARGTILTPRVITWGTPHHYPLR
jgi:2'-5' RNA ligase